MYLRKKNEEGVIIIEDSKNYSQIYQDMFALLGDKDAVMKIHEHYGGRTVNFPRKLYSQSYTEKYICENYGVQPINMISSHLGIGTRRVMQIAKELGLTKPRRKSTKSQENKALYKKYRI